MFYTVLSIFFVIIGIAILFASLRVLMKSGWFMGWVRGTVGLGLVAIGVFMGLAAFDLYSYEQIVQEQAVATVNFEQAGEQRYRATVVDNKGQESSYVIAGDQWQMEARILKWPNSFAKVGIKPGYRLDRISGRYYSLEQERTAERTVYSIGESQIGVDVWAMLHDFGENSLVDAKYGSATFVPMADGALYEVRLSNTGLLARPLNEPANEALSSWQ